MSKILHRLKQSILVELWQSGYGLQSRPLEKRVQALSYGFTLYRQALRSLYRQGLITVSGEGLKAIYSIAPDATDRVQALIEI